MKQTFYAPSPITKLTLTGTFERYLHTAMGAFPDLQGEQFVDWLRGRFQQTSFSRWDGYVLAMCQWYDINGIWDRDRLAAYYPEHQVPRPLDLCELDMFVLPPGGVVPFCPWPDAVLKEWTQHRSSVVV